MTSRMWTLMTRRDGGVPLVSSAWSGTSGTIPEQTLTDVSLTLGGADSGPRAFNTGSGTVNWSFNLADYKDVDFLAAGETANTGLPALASEDDSEAGNASLGGADGDDGLTRTSDQPGDHRLRRR